MSVLVFTALPSHGMDQPDNKFFTRNLIAIGGKNFDVDDWWKTKSLDEQELAREHLLPYLCYKLFNVIIDDRDKVISAIKFLIAQDANVTGVYTHPDLTSKCMMLGELINDPKLFTEVVVNQKIKVGPASVNAPFQGKTLFDIFVERLNNYLSRFQKIKWPQYVFREFPEEEIFKTLHFLLEKGFRNFDASSYIYKEGAYKGLLDLIEKTQDILKEENHKKWRYEPMIEAYTKVLNTWLNIRDDVDCFRRPLLYFEKKLHQKVGSQFFSDCIIER